MRFQTQSYNKVIKHSHCIVNSLLVKVINLRKVTIEFSFCQNRLFQEKLLFQQNAVKPHPASLQQHGLVVE